MRCVAGSILLEDGFKDGYITYNIKNMPVLHFEKTKEQIQYEGLIIPSFVNAHTHIGDSFIRKMKIPLPKDIKSLVGPPNGLKHQLLQSTDQNTIRQGMHLAIDEMRTCGTSVFLDFRENGIKGSSLLLRSAEPVTVRPLIFGRPTSILYDEKELLELFKIVDGIGLSSISDWNQDHLELVVSLAKKNNIPIAFHASESKREDIETLLSYDPFFLVHMTQATKQDLRTVAEETIPIVVCPRSNNFFDLTPPLRQMKEQQVQLLLGTDNAMLHSPCILDEIKFVLELFPDIFTLEELLIMATYGPRKVLNLKDGIPGANFPSSFVVLEPGSLQIISTTVGS